jgi:hypothetical protein
LIIRMVGQNHSSAPMLPCHAGKKGKPLSTRSGFHGFIALFHAPSHIRTRHFTPISKLTGQLGHKPCISSCGTATQSMVEMTHHEPAKPCAVENPQQRHGIGTAGNADQPFSATGG